MTNQSEYTRLWRERSGHLFCSLEIERDKVMFYKPLQSVGRKCQQLRLGQIHAGPRTNLDPKAVVPLSPTRALSQAYQSMQ